MQGSLWVRIAVLFDNLTALIQQNFDAIGAQLYSADDLAFTLSNNGRFLYDMLLQVSPI